MTETPSGRWRPLLDGEEAERAWAAVHAVAEALRPEAKIREDDPTFPEGSAGFAVFYDYLGRATGDDRWSEYAEHFLDRAIDGLAARPLPPMLYGGIAGIGWAVEHLSEEDEYDEDDEDPIAGALLQVLGHDPVRGDYELMNGVAGYGFFAIEALPRPGARRCLELVIEHLAQTGERVGDGFSWFTPFDMLPEHQQTLAPRGYYNLGVAHGVPAVISLLGTCAGLGVLTPEQRRMLDGAVDWLLSLRYRGDGWSFPTWVGEETERGRARLAWCYGDPGVAAALMTAARHAGERAWEAAALDIARESTERPDEESGVYDAPFCHGSAGLGHLFNRMHQATGDAALGEAAHRWLRHTLDQWKPGEGIGGFLAGRPAESEMRWASEPGILLGSAGVALALLAAVTPLEPAWDRALATSVPLARSATR